MNHTDKQAFKLDGDLVAWTEFASSFYGGDMTQYINEAIRGDMQSGFGASRVSDGGKTVIEMFEEWRGLRESFREIEAALNPER